MTVFQMLCSIHAAWPLTLSVSPVSGVQASRYQVEKLPPLGTGTIMILPAVSVVVTAKGIVLRM